MPLKDDAVNQILPFAMDGLESAGDLMTLADYEASTLRLRGHQPGIAQRSLENRALRQALLVSTGVAQFVANRFAPGVKDNGDIDAVEIGLVAAVEAIIADHAPDLSGVVATDRKVDTKAPLTGGGALNKDLTLGISAATQTAAGSMSADDKKKLDGMAASGALPAMNGEASAGTAPEYARSDHVHPTDESITFTKRVVLTASGQFVAEKTGWHRRKCIGGGAAGGGANKRGGGGGGDTKCGTLTARGGGGGDGSVVGTTAAGAGGGGPGEVVEDLIWLEKGEILPVNIGAGGVCSTVDSTAATGLGAAPLLSTTRNMPGMGGIGAQPGLTSGVYDSGGAYGGSGGSGGRNGTGYGGGGGGAAGYGSANSNVYHSPGGAAIDGGMPGANSNATAHQGGNGGPGAVIIEF